MEPFVLRESFKQLLSSSYAQIVKCVLKTIEQKVMNNEEEKEQFRKELVCDIVDAVPRTHANKDRKFTLTVRYPGINVVYDAGGPWRVRVR